MKAGREWLVVMAVAACGTETAAPDAMSPDAQRSLVTGRVGTVYYPVGDSITVPVDLSAAVVRAWVEGPGPELVELAGSGDAEGRFEIPDVPEEPTLIQVNRLYVVTAERELDLSDEWAGRPDIESAVDGTQLRMILDGMQPWSNGDEIDLWWPNHGWFVLTAWGEDVALGATTVDYTTDLYFGVDPTQGDRALALQLASVDLGPGRVQVAARALELEPFTPIPGGVIETTGSLVELARDRAFQLRWNSTAWAGHAQDVHLEALSLRPSWGLYSRAPGTRLGHVIASPAVVVGRYWPQIDIDVSVSYADPYASNDPMYLYAETAFAAELDVAGAVEPPLVFGYMMRAAEIGEVDGESLRVELSPPRRPQINGLSARVNHNGVGLTPHLTWSPPGIGDPDAYRVTVSEVSLVDSWVTPVARFVTPKTELRLPPAVLEQGTIYTFEIEALRSPAVDFARAPLLERLPYARTSALTGAFTP